jgi:hypothetical protein
MENEYNSINKYFIIGLVIVVVTVISINILVNFF